MRYLHRLSLWLVLCLSLTSLAAQPADSTDILAEVLRMQAAMPAPGTNFRPGHATPRQGDSLTHLRTGGFALHLPHTGLVPTPAVAGDLLYTGGGFGSKQFFAFDAQTGALRWAVDLDDDGPSTPVVADGLVVFNTESCTLFALDAETGEQRWAWWLGDPLMSTPTIAHGLVFTAYPARSRGGSYPGLIQQSNTGWPNQVQQQVQMPVPDAPATGDYDGPLQPTHVLIALDLQTGAVRWQRWINGDVMSAPIAAGDELHVATFAGTYYKLDQQSGEILAARATRATSAPVVVGQEVYMSQRADVDGDVREQVAVASRSSGAIKARGHARSAPYLDYQVQARANFKALAAESDAGNGFGDGAPAAAAWGLAAGNIGQSNVASLQAFQGSRLLTMGGQSYATMGDTLLCTLAGSDSVRWKHGLRGDLAAEGGFLGTPPIAAGGKLIIATLAGEVILLDAQTGAEVQRYAVSEPVRYQPIVMGGRIYVTTTYGKLICIETGDPSLTGWSTWGADAAHSNLPAE